MTPEQEDLLDMARESLGAAFEAWQCAMPETTANLGVLHRKSQRNR